MTQWQQGPKEAAHRDRLWTTPGCGCSSLGIRLLPADPHCNQGRPGPQVRSPRASSPLGPKPRPLPTHRPSPQLRTPSGRSRLGCGARLHVEERRTAWSCFCPTQQPLSLSSWGPVGIDAFLSAVFHHPCWPVFPRGQRSWPFTSWASSARTSPQQDSGNKGPQGRCPFLTKPGIPDDFDIIQMSALGMSPVDSQGPLFLSCWDTPSPSSHKGTQPGEDPETAEGQQTGKACQPDFTALRRLYHI